MIASHHIRSKSFIAVAVLFAVCAGSYGQASSQETKVFTLEQAVDFALKNYPAVRASRLDPVVALRSD